MIRNLDDNVGRVLDHIEKLGIADKTIVVFASDNGGYIGKWNTSTVTDNYPLRSGKGSLYEGGIRVPLIIRWPGTGSHDALCNEPVISNDFFPTILEMTGLLKTGSYESSDCTSLAPLLRNPSSRLTRDTLFFHYPHYYETTTPVSALRKQNWKLLEYMESDQCELYDLASDPSEIHDVASANPQVTKRLRDDLNAWRTSIKAQMPTVNPRVAATPEKDRWDLADRRLALVD
jgi:arylsulfatase A-like enzyme